MAEHLREFLPGHPYEEGLGSGAVVSAAAFGSASILPITWAYVRMMGADGLRRATLTAIASANYLARRIGPDFPVLYSGDGGWVAHECILDLGRSSTRSASRSTTWPRGWRITVSTRPR